MNLLLPTEAAHKLRISRAKFYQMIKKGQVQPYNVGGKTVFKEDELEALVEKGAGRKKKVRAGEEQCATPCASMEPANFVTPSGVHQ